MSEFNNLLSDGGVPLGFGMGISQDLKALDKFASMTDREKRDVIEGAKKQHTREDMISYISRMHD